MPSSPIPPGVDTRELDQRIAIEVMGWSWWRTWRDERFLAPPGYVHGDPLYRAEPTSDLALPIEEAGAWWLDAVRRFTDAEIVPHYSTDIAAAFLVVQAMRAHRADFRAMLTDRGFLGYAYRYCPPTDPEGRDYIDGWTCEFRPCSLDYRYQPVELGAPSLPLAICLAALATLKLERAA